MKFENTKVYGFDGALHGMRNPLESWSKSDSKFGICDDNEFSDIARQVAIASSNSDKECNDYWEFLINNGAIETSNDHFINYSLIGKNDLNLAQKLIKAGSEHRKFMRQIFVSVDITAPIYW